MKRLLIALYSFLGGVNFSLVGQLRLSEVVVLLSAPFCIKKEDFRNFPYFRKIVFALVLLLAFQVVTDLLVVHNSPQNYSRGWAATIMSILSFVVLFRLMEDERTIVIFVFFSVIKNIVFTDEIVGTDMSYFKFKMVPILANTVYLVTIYLYGKGRLQLTLAVLLSFSLLCFAMDSRSTGMSCFLGAAIIYFFNSNIRLTRVRVIGITVIAVVLFQLSYMFYVTSVLNHEIGGQHSAEQLERLSNPYNPFELLMTGRGETFVAMTAISDAPVFGHGSWAEDKSLKYYQILLTFHDEELDLTKAYSEDRLIPSHSILMGAWINCGIGGFIAVSLILFYLAKMCFYLIANAVDSKYYPMLVLMTISIIWAFCFSPFQQLRFSIPAMGCIVMRIYYDYMASQEADDEDEEEEEEEAEEGSPVLYQKI